MPLSQLAFYCAMGMLYFCIAFVPLLHILRKKFPTVKSMVLADVLILLFMSAVLPYRAGFPDFALRLSERGFIALQPFLFVFGGIAAAFFLSAKLPKSGYRMTFHVVSGVLILYFLTLDVNMTFIIIAFSLTLFVIAEYVRTCEDKNEMSLFVRKVFEPALRAGEEKRYLATFHFLLGSLIVVMYLPANIAFSSVALLAFGDSSASIFGSRFGKKRLIYNKEKSVVGSAAMFAVCVLVLLFMSIPPMRSLMIAAVAAFSESLPTKGTDNLVIPVVSGVALFYL